MRFLLAFVHGGLLSPLLPLLHETFHVTYAELGLLTSMSGVSCVVMDVVATHILQRRPLLRVLLGGIVITGLGLLGSMCAPGFYWLVGAQMLLGLGSSLTRAAGLMVVVAATPRAAMGRAHNLLEFSAIAGHTISPTLSGLTAALIHWRAAFALALLFVAGAFGWVLYTRHALADAVRAPAVRPNPGQAPTAPAGQSPMAAPIQRPPRKAVWIAYIATFVLSFTWSGFLSTALPLFAGEVVGLSTVALGVVLTIGLAFDLVLLLPVGWLSDRLDCRTVLAPAMLLMATTLVWLPYAHSFGALVVVSICLHIGFAAWGMPSAALALLSPGEHLARTMGIYRLLVDGAVVLAPWLIGTLIGLYGYGIPTWGTAVMIALSAFLVAQGLRPAYLKGG